MTTHTRSENQTAISVSLSRDLLDQVDARARSLGLNRSQYLAQLARQDLSERGALVLRAAPVPAVYPSASPAAASLNEDVNSTDPSTDPAAVAGQVLNAAIGAAAAATRPSRPSARPTKRKVVRHSKSATPAA